MKVKAKKKDGELVVVMEQPVEVMQGSMSSVQINESTSGVVTVTVKCYSDDIDDAETKAVEVYERLRKKVSTLGKADKQKARKRKS